MNSRSDNRNTIVFVLVMVLVFSLLDFWGYGLSSILSHHKQIQEVREQIATEQNTAATINHISKQVDRWRKKSISQDPARAISVYQRALLQLADGLGVADLTAEPAPREIFVALGRE